MKYFPTIIFASMLCIAKFNSTAILHNARSIYPNEPAQTSYLMDEIRCECIDQLKAYESISDEYENQHFEYWLAATYLINNGHFSDQEE